MSPFLETQKDKEGHVWNPGPRTRDNRLPHQSRVFLVLRLVLVKKKKKKKKNGLTCVWPPALRLNSNLYNCIQYTAMKSFETQLQGGRTV
jgi:hypothetical protein